MEEIFGDNLLFAFVFGSVAKRTARFDVPNASDLDTFICLKESNLEQSKRYGRWVIKFQLEIGLKADLDYVAEIVTQSELDVNLEKASGCLLSLHSNSQQMFDSIIWLDALKFEKISVVDQYKKLPIYMSKVNNVFKHFHQDIIEQFTKSQLPNKKSIESGLVKNKSDLSILRAQITNNYIKDREVMFFIQNTVPLGSKEVTSSQDDLNYFRNNYYVKNVL